MQQSKTQSWHRLNRDKNNVRIKIKIKKNVLVISIIAILLKKLEILKTLLKIKTGIYLNRLFYFNFLKLLFPSA